MTGVRAGVVRGGLLFLAGVCVVLAAVILTFSRGPSTGR